jgi:multidrug efflux pump subunit AcrA (membrane-fusion protein)
MPSDERIVVVATLGGELGLAGLLAWLWSQQQAGLVAARASAEATQIAQLQSQTSQLQSQVSGLQGQVSQLTSAYQGAEQQLSQTQAALQAAQAQASRYENLSTSLQAQLASVQSQYQAAQASLSTDTQQLQALQAQVQSLQAQLAHAQQQAQSYQQQVASLQSQLSQVPAQTFQPTLQPTTTTTTNPVPTTTGQPFIVVQGGTVQVSFSPQPGDIYASMTLCNQGQAAGSVGLTATVHEGGPNGPVVAIWVQSSPYLVPGQCQPLTMDIPVQWQYGTYYYVWVQPGNPG